MTALQVMSPHGEVVEAVTAERLLAAFGIPDLAEADTPSLVTARDGLSLLRSIASEADELVNTALVDACDRDMAWGTNAIELADGSKVSTDPPTAGTERYDDDALDALLGDLLAEGVITAAACDRVRVPHLGTVAVGEEFLQAALDALGGIIGHPEHAALTERTRSLLREIPKTTYKTSLLGVAALRKLSPEIAERVDACKLEPQKPKRKAKVKRAPARAAA